MNTHIFEIACSFAGLCYAELAAMIPASGSAYTYAYATVGEIFAWIIGWDLILEYAMGASTVAVGWSGYFVSLLGSFGIHIPPQWADATGQAVKLADGTTGTAMSSPATETNTSWGSGWGVRLLDRLVADVCEERAAS